MVRTKSADNLRARSLDRALSLGPVLTFPASERCFLPKNDNFVNRSRKFLYNSNRASD